VAQTADDRADALIAALQLQPHPEGGFFREVFRSARQVSTLDTRGARCALTSIDFLLRRGEFSAWHRVASDEVWHLLEGVPLRLWLMPPSLDAVHAVTLGEAMAGQAPRHVVPAHWWQAAEATDGYAYCGATVGPGFEFADFSFLREDVPARKALEHLQPGLLRLL
jgi:predicted cupin superfamily sugar epimerase